MYFLKETPTKCYDKFSHPVFSKLLKRFYPIAITKGDYIQLYTIYIKQKPDND